MCSRGSVIFPFGEFFLGVIDSLAVHIAATFQLALLEWLVVILILHCHHLQIF